MGTFFQDLKHSVRMFGQSKIFTATAVAALALGIGATSAIFSIVNAVLLKPVPFPEPDRLVMFMNTTPGGQGQAASPAKFEHWRSQSTVQDSAAFRTGLVNYTGGEVAEQLRSAQVSADYFKVFGAPIIRGRTFSREEDLPNGEKVVLISYSLWTRRFASDPSIIGKKISLSGEPHVVIGIVGPTFDVREFGPAPDVWTAFQLDPNTTDQGHYFAAAGRLKPGVLLDQAKAEFQKSAGEYRQKFPNAIGPADGFTVERFQDAFVRNVRETLLVLLGAVSFVLLIACANVANLLLVRATGRKREIAIRASLGAGRTRIIRQLLTESVLLSLAGGTLGIVLGVIGIRALLSVNTAGLPRVGENGTLVGIDWRVLAFTLLVSLGTGIIFGLIPALQGARTDLNSSLKESGGRTGTGLRQNKFRSLLVVVEIALAVILLVGSALFIRSQIALSSVNPGFDTTNVLTMRMSLTGPRFLQSAGVERIVREGVDRIRSLPGVVSAAATCCVPLQGGYGLPFRIVGRPLAKTPFHGGGGWLTISSGYFDVFKIPIKRGRAFTDRDDASAPPVVIINETMAKQYWVKGDDPLNARLVIGRGIMREFRDEPERQIVGIAGDVRDGGLNFEPQPRMYIPEAQQQDAVNALNVRIAPIAWAVRTQVAPSSLSGAVQEQLRQVTGLPVSDIRTMNDVVSLSTSRQRFNMLLMTVFAGSALLLAAIGIYGLMAYSVEQRTAEIGIRLALGAEVSRVKRMIVLQGMRLAVLGVIVGVSFAFNLTSLIGRFLFSVKPWDPMVFFTIPAVLSAIALLAVWLPARRASRINPIDALRYE
jgi:putative ABC transport system permease protein